MHGFVCISDKVWGFDSLLSERKSTLFWGHIYSGGKGGGKR